MILCGEGGCTTTRIEALNTDEPLIREDVQPCKVLRVDGDHEAYADRRIFVAGSTKRFLLARRATCCRFRMRSWRSCSA